MNGLIDLEDRIDREKWEGRLDRGRGRGRGRGGLVRVGGRLDRGRGRRRRGLGGRLDRRRGRGRGRGRGGLVRVGGRLDRRRRGFWLDGLFVFDLAIPNAGNGADQQAD